MDISFFKKNIPFNQKLLTGIIWRGCNVLTAFIFNAILVRQIGAAGSGVFFYLLNNLFFAILILSISLEGGISFYNSRKEIDESYLFSISIIWSLLGGIVFFIIIFFLPENKLHLHYGNLFLTAYVFGSMLTTFLSSIYFTNHNSKIPNLVITITNIILILLMPKMPWINGRINFDTYILLYLSSFLLPSVALTFLLLNQKKVFSFAFLRAKTLKPLFLFSTQSFILALLFNLLKRSDFWLVNKWCSSSDAGNYFQASKLIQVLLLLPTLASFSLYPLIVESIKIDENDKANTDTVTKVMKLLSLYFGMAFLLGLGVVLFGYWLFPLFYGPTFTNLYSVILFLIPGLICFAATYPLTVYFSGKDQNISMIIFLGISISVLIVSNVILIPKYHIYGAAISNSLGNFLYFSLLLNKFLVQNKLPFSRKTFTIISK